MTQEGRIDDWPLIAYSDVRTGHTVAAGHTINRAVGANIVATGRPAKFAVTAGLAGAQTLRLSYVRSHASMKYLRIAWYYRPDPVVTVTTIRTLTLALTLRDAAGNTVSGASAIMPRSLDGSSVTTITGTLTTNFALGGVGVIDLDSVAATLVDPTWELSFAWSRSGGDVTLDHIEAWECPRELVDSANAAGVLTGPLNPGGLVLAGSTTTQGYERIAKTIEAGIASNHTYLNVAWAVDITASPPRTTSATFTAFTGMLEGGTTPWPWRFRPRALYLPSSAAGEPARFRVLYYVSGGGTAYVRINTGATTPTYNTAALTGAAWTWSAWVACSLPTNGTGRVVTCTFTGKTSAGTLYVAAIVVEENQ